MYGRTIQGLTSEMGNAQKKHIDTALCIQTEKPMPDCFNDGVSLLLETNPDYIWMVEEDNEVPQGILDKMLVQIRRDSCDAVTLDYHVGQYGASHINRDSYGEFLYCGFGCILIRADVFREIAYPWFVVDKKINQDGDIIQLPEHRVPRDYGGHDAYFFMVKAKGLDLKVGVVPEIVGEHYRTREIPKIERNSGSYTIYSL